MAKSKNPKVMLSIEDAEALFLVVELLVEQGKADLLPVHARLGRALAVAKRKREKLIELAEDLGEACWEPEGDK